LEANARGWRALGAIIVLPSLASAQQGDQQLRQQIEPIVAAYQDAVNKLDAAASPVTPSMQGRLRFIFSFLRRHLFYLAAFRGTAFQGAMLIMDRAKYRRHLGQDMTNSVSRPPRSPKPVSSLP
jgi:hypothetical protein